MATVIALACASLTYTSCTKDYDEEINNVNKNVEALQSKLQGEIDGLKSDVASLKSGLSSLETAYKAADAALQKDITDLTKKVSANETAIAQLNAAIAKFATKDELAAKATELEGKIAAVATDLASAKEEILAKATELEAQVKDNAEAIAAIQEVYAALSDELRSIVFIPDLYFAGIEATEYTYAVINGMDYVYEMDGNKKIDAKYDDLKIKTISNKQPTAATKVVVAAGQPIKTKATQVPKVVNGKPSKTEKVDLVYTLGQQGIAKYNLNPSNFNVEKAEWALYGADYRYVTKGDAEQSWKPVFEGIKVVDGVAEVAYRIEGAENINTTVDTTAYANEGIVPVMNLVATLDSAKTISSDYEAILVSPEAIKSLAFAQNNNNWVTENTAHTCNMAGDDPKNNKELYCTVDSAIVNMPSVEIVYNGGSQNLADWIVVHMAGEKEEELTLAELNAAYGDQFTMTFDNINYIVGDEKTSENMYAEVTKEGIYTPMYVKTGTKPTSEACGTDKNDMKGISSVGRQPVILVTLWNGEQVVLAQYFKVEVIEKNIVNTPVVIPSFGDIPYICDTVELATTWHQFSDLVLETVGVSYKEFANYLPEKGGTPADSIKLYVKDAKGNYVDQVVTGKDDAGNDVKDDVNHVFGYVTYLKDAATDGVNNALVWDAEPINIAKYNSDNTQSVYVHFVDKNNDKNNVWVELTTTVVKPAGYKYGQKIANEWYNDIDGEIKNTGRINVYVPNVKADETNNIVITGFYRDLNHFLVGSKPSISLTEDSDPIYAQIASEDGSPLAKKETIAPAIEYSFSAEQPAIDGIQLYTNADGDSLFAAKYDNDGKIVKEKVGDKYVPVLDKNYVVAVLGHKDATEDAAQVDSVVYQPTEIAKTLLNKWSYKEEEQAKMLYANIDVALTYGKCEIPAGDDHFHVRFVRPLDVNFASQDVSEESAVNGFSVEIAKFIAGITDWNNQAVIVDSLDNKGKATGNIIENVIKGVNMYKYYKFDNMYIDLENAARDSWDIADASKVGLVNDVTPNAKLAIGTVDSKGIFTEGTYTPVEGMGRKVSIADFANLKSLVINYRNDNAVVESFKLYIPVKIGYAWGTIAGTLEVTVKKTADTEGK